MTYPPAVGHTVGMVDSTVPLGDAPATVQDVPTDTLPLPFTPAPAPPSTVRKGRATATVVPATVPTVPDERAEHLTALGVDAERWQRFERHEAEWEAKLPEIERIRREHRQQAGQLEALRRAGEQDRARYSAQVEQNVALLNRNLAGEMARAVNLVPEPTAMEDLFQLIHGCTQTDADGAVLFREGKTEINREDPEFAKKLSQHIATTRPHWLASRMAAGGGGLGRPAGNVTMRQEPPKTRAELADTMMARIVAGGKQAAGGR